MIALALLFVNLIINFYIKIYLMVRRAGLRVLKLKSKVGESSVISKSHQLSGIKDGQKPATTSAEGSESSGTTRPSVTFILGTGSPSAAVTTAKASNAIAISAAIDGVIVSMGSSTGGQQILSHTHQQHSGTSSAPLNNVNKDICRTTNTSIENAVFRLCLILLLILVVFWTPLLLMMVYELFSQHRAPIWLQIAAFNIVTLDYAFATPIALIRFHKVYRRLWYRHVLPSRMHKWRMVIFVWGEYTASGGGDE